MNQRHVIRHLASSAFVMSLLLSGCDGEFSYKRGAQYHDLQSSKSECTETGKTKADINACLEKQGWVIVDTDKKMTDEDIFNESEDIFSESIETSYTKSQSDPFVPAEPVESAAAKKKPKLDTSDPLKPVKINSWWKMGAGAPELYADGGDCKTELGSDHYASENFSEISVGIAKCMHKKGWRFILGKNEM